MPDSKPVALITGSARRVGAVIARSLHAAGYDLALVGSALMQAADPPQLVRDMLRAGRAARRGMPPAEQR